MTKKLFKGTFNYSGYVFPLHTHAISKDRAFLNFINQISKKLNVGKATVLSRFDGSIDNYLIEEVVRDDH